jgi:hypothetical protein
MSCMSAENGNGHASALDDEPILHPAAPYDKGREHQDSRPGLLLPNGLRLAGHGDASAIPPL